jgi:hypothetical protein
MNTLGTEILPVRAQLVDADIGRYVSNALSRHRKLSQLNGTTKVMIIETFVKKADGM